MRLSDLLATCAAVVGTELPEDAGEDSWNVLPVRTGKETAPAASPRRDLIHHSGGGVFALRSDDGRGRWKMIFECAGDGRGGAPIPVTAGQLYDLSRDLGETANVWYRHPEVVRALIARLEAQRSAPRSVVLSD